MEVVMEIYLWNSINMDDWDLATWSTGHCCHVSRAKAHALGCEATVQKIPVLEAVSKGRAMLLTQENSHVKSSCLQPNITCFCWWKPRNAKNLESHCPGHSLIASSAKISIYRLDPSNQIALTAGQDSPAKIGNPRNQKLDGWKHNGWFHEGSC